MSRIKRCFDGLHEQRRRALIPYITAGDPTPELTVRIMHQLVDAGADLVELGVPFSDPMADGPVIQAACERALAHGVTLHDVLEMVALFRRDNDETPVILMGYLNPVEVYGYEAFAKAAHEAGVDGTLIVDMPPEESAPLLAALGDQAIDPIFLIAPTTPPDRISYIAASGSGFIYYVSLKGVTGAAHIDIESVERKLNEVRKATKLPLGVGFGIRDAASAAAVAVFADAVVVGSAVVKILAENVDNQEKLINDIKDLIASMRAAIDEHLASNSGIMQAVRQ